MNTHNAIRQTLLALMVVFAGASSSSLLATEQRECPDPSKEDREKMAAAHEQMAACLRSDKSFVECHQELAKSQHQMMRMKHCLDGKHMLPNAGGHSDTHSGQKN